MCVVVHVHLMTAPENPVIVLNNKFAQPPPLYKIYNIGQQFVGTCEAGGESVILPLPGALSKRKARMALALLMLRRHADVEEVVVVDNVETVERFRKEMMEACARLISKADLEDELNRLLPALDDISKSAYGGVLGVRVKRLRIGLDVYVTGGE